ncbi:MAG: hypothetical protein DDT22_01348 [candidate division WS2 bacterium]|nr:hypothetical protein [Candidatus Lithacetigena glycinireducens]
MGRGLISQSFTIPWVKISAICDHKPERVLDSLNHSGYDYGELVQVGDIKEGEKALQEGALVLTMNTSLLCSFPSLEVIIDATGTPEGGALTASQAIKAGKHIALLTVETDSLVGRILRKKAEERGVVYTLAAGDEPAAAKELYDFAVSLGFKVVAIGKGKNNPFNPYATPKMLGEEASRKRMNPRMLCSFVDGTKTAVEMTSLSNATGLLPDKRGMHGVKACVEDMPAIFSLKKDGGILENEGIVDYVFGLAPGVFVVYETEDKESQAILSYLKIGEGPRYLLYRPYHLTSLESFTSVYRAVLYKEPTLIPLYTPYSEVIACAKRNLQVGEIIDGIGGETIYGVIESFKVSRKERLVPLGLLKGAEVIRDIQKDTFITWADIILKEGFLLSLYREQEELLTVK